MSKARIQNSILSGSLTAPPSKSAAHRALICSFLSGGGTVKPIINSKDMDATVGVINALKNNDDVLDCIESGSTMRFMIPVAAALGKNVTFTGRGSLLSRTVGEYIELLPLHGVKVESSGTLPLTISGKLKNGSFDVNGDVSSQYVTGLLLALSALEGDSAVIMKTPLQSKPYVDMTVKILSDYGVKIKETDFGYLIKGSQKFKQLDYVIEGDWSQAAFFLVAGAIGGDVTVSGLDFNSAQGDKKIVEILNNFGAQTETSDNFVRCKKSVLKGTTVNASDIPDLVPAIAVLAAYSQGETVISGAQRLKYKESNRLESVVTNLRMMGVDAHQTDDGMIINGGEKPRGAAISSFNDHRIVMAFSVAGLFANGETVIDCAESVNKSYPSFFEDYKILGGIADVF